MFVSPSVSVGFGAVGDDAELFAAAKRKQWATRATHVLACSDVLVCTLLYLATFQFSWKEAWAGVFKYSVATSIADCLWLSLLRAFLFVIPALALSRRWEIEMFIKSVSGGRGANTAAEGSHAAVRILSSSRGVLIALGMLCTAKSLLFDWGHRQAAIQAGRSVEYADICLAISVVFPFAEAFAMGKVITSLEDENRLRSLKQALLEIHSRPFEDIEDLQTEFGGRGRRRLSDTSLAQEIEKVNEQYASSMTLWDLIKVLRPFFWPHHRPSQKQNRAHKLHVLRLRLQCLATWIVVIGSKAASVSAPLFLGRAANTMVTGDRESLLTNLVIFCGLTFVSKLLGESQRMLYLEVQQMASVELSELTFAHIHSLSLQWHLKKRMGNVIRSMDRGVDAATSLMNFGVLRLLPVIGECLAVCVVFYTKLDSKSLAAVLFLALSLYAYVTISMTLWRQTIRKEANIRDNMIHDISNDSFINYETVKYFNNEEYETMRYTDAVEQFQSYSVAVSLSLSGLNLVQQLIQQSATLIGLYIGGREILHEGFSQGNVGNFVAINAYLLSAFTPLNFLGTIYNVIVKAVTDLQNLSQLLAEQPDITDTPGAQPLPWCPDRQVRIPRNLQANFVSARGDAPKTSCSSHSGLSVEFRNVFFRYPTQPYHRGLRDISFFVEQGTTCALVGHTGAGKSTIGRLLFRFFDPTSGEILLHGCDIRNHLQQSVRSCIGVVPQDTVLFNDTLWHNIWYGNIVASEEEVYQAAELAHLTEFIESLPLKWATVVGERGLKLSGGEKQRVAIARCFLKDPPIILLDEATSALDSQTESHIQDALRSLRRNRTTLIIAHRLSTIKSADQIIVLHEGEIAERGTHDELIGLAGSYHNLWDMQISALRRGSFDVSSAASQFDMVLEAPSTKQLYNVE